MCLEHREALLLLVAHGAHTSAAALQRPLLEARVTGAWIDTCATDDELRAIARDTFQVRATRTASAITNIGLPRLVRPLRRD